ncbi:hypothetical protein E0W68_13655 [Flavobacterium salilacus subsp. salilacus]|uniref:hypothetical protein n=1 Tax=Flavobacterium TaxID=237 RepID=UPI0010755AC5|nr:MULTISPECIES: hypothetical protein [Flavobacterium]KAF2514513.1 hypothetical protein E0W68_13655 [Flavobacterium salilacus subsp. salilacus]MBE1615942.1 hypothetical protein [Flavobacterium sp. SaA2.13]
MKEIEQIYHNEFGVAFHWIKNDAVLTERVQLIFKETGFYLEHHELDEFKMLVNATCAQYNCNDCCYRQACQRVLLKTPVSEVDLAVTQKELYLIKDLMEGTLFNLNLSYYIKELCSN